MCMGYEVMNWPPYVTMFIASSDSTVQNDTPDPKMNNPMKNRMPPRIDTSRKLIFSGDHDTRSNDNATAKMMPPCTMRPMRLSTNWEAITCTKGCTGRTNT